LGEHNTEILSGLGYDTQQIEKLGASLPETLNQHINAPARKG
jgi:hypothetical protein